MTKYLIRKKICGEWHYLGVYGDDGIPLWQPYNEHALCFNEYPTACAFLGGYVFAEKSEGVNMPEVVSSEKVEGFINA